MPVGVSDLFIVITYEYVCDINLVLSTVETE